MKRYLLALCLAFCGSFPLAALPEDALYASFRTPEMKYRPQVRWWWNGDKVNEGEILRELDVMKAAGIGGVEINPIAFPGGDSIGLPSLEWGSPAWARMVKVAVDGCADRGMVADMIVGSGWPFGSETLPRAQQLQLLTVETFDIPAGQAFSISVADLLSRVNPAIHSPYRDPGKELVSVRLMPREITQFTEGVSYDGQVGQATLDIPAPEEDSVLYCFVKLTGFMAVINGAPGAQGPVLNHFDKEAARMYLNRLTTAVDPLLGRMGDHLRAAFCDSFETEGSNWDDAMRDEFRRRRGYDIWPYLPYIIYKVGPMGNPVNEAYGARISLDSLGTDLVERVRSDFERTMRERFREGFIDVFNAWCRENGVRSRIQAYGRGLHPLESSMSLGIPEGESWLFDTNGYQMPPFTILHRGYSVNNKLVASASLLAGNGMVSCEEQTNTSHVFFTTMDNLKVTGDMSNLSGVNQTILHGFNYSPAQVPFPGWVRYGCYFNERNSWWPHIRLWMDYKARLSALFQQVTPYADIAVLPAFEDLWSKLGGQRDPFPDHIYPEYAYHLWEAIHQGGSSCEYISEGILEGGRVGGGVLRYGDRRYTTLLLTEVERISPKAARRLRRFVRGGGLVICIGKRPCKSYGLHQAEKRDAAVRRALRGLETRYPDRYVLTDAPSGEDMLPWWLDVRRVHGIGQGVVFSDPGLFISQNHYTRADRHVFFITNYSAVSPSTQTLSFPQVSRDLTAWLWDAETGCRYRLPAWQDGLTLSFQPEESKLIVFDHDTEGAPYVPPLLRTGATERQVEGPWDLHFRHAVTGETSDFRTDVLFNLLDDERTRFFAGDVDYTCSFDVEDPSAFRMLDAGQANGGVVELFLNGRSLGRKWYGYRQWAVDGLLLPGRNTLTLRCTTPLGNYMKSLSSNSVAMAWTRHHRFADAGITGPVVLY